MVAVRGVEVPDGPRVDEVVAGVLVEERRGVLHVVGVLGERLHEEALGERAEVEVPAQVAVRLASLVHRLLEVFADVAHLALRRVLRALDHDAADGRLEPGALGPVVAVVDLEQVAAADVARLLHAGYVLVLVPVRVHALLGGVVLQGLAVERAVQLLEVGDVDATAADLHLLGEEIGPAVLAVVVEVDVLAVGRVGEAERLRERVRDVVAHERRVVVVRQEHPGLRLVLVVAGHEAGRAAEFDLVGLLGALPGGVAAPLDLLELAVVDDRAVGVDERHGARGLRAVVLAALDVLAALLVGVVAHDVEGLEARGPHDVHPRRARVVVRLDVELVAAGRVLRERAVGEVDRVARPVRGEPGDEVARDVDRRGRAPGDEAEAERGGVGVGGEEDVDGAVEHGAHDGGVVALGVRDACRESVEVDVGVPDAEGDGREVARRAVYRGDRLHPAAVGREVMFAERGRPRAVGLLDGLVPAVGAVEAGDEEGDVARPLDDPAAHVHHDVARDGSRLGPERLAAGGEAQGARRPAPFDGAPHLVAHVGLDRPGAALPAEVGGGDGRRPHAAAHVREPEPGLRAGGGGQLGRDELDACGARRAGRCDGDARGRGVVGERGGRRRFAEDEGARGRTCVDAAPRRVAHGEADRPDALLPAEARRRDARRPVAPAHALEPEPGHGARGGDEARGDELDARGAGDVGRQDRDVSGHVVVGERGGRRGVAEGEPARRRPRVDAAPRRVAHGEPHVPGAFLPAEARRRHRGRPDAPAFALALAGRPCRPGSPGRPCVFEAQPGLGPRGGDEARGDELDARGARDVGRRYGDARGRWVVGERRGGDRLAEVERARGGAGLDARPRGVAHDEAHRPGTLLPAEAYGGDGGGPGVGSLAREAHPGLGARRRGQARRDELDPRGARDARGPHRDARGDGVVGERRRPDRALEGYRDLGVRIGCGVGCGVAGLDGVGVRGHVFLVRGHVFFGSLAGIGPARGGRCGRLGRRSLGDRRGVGLGTVVACGCASGFRRSPVGGGPVSGRPMCGRPIDAARLVRGTLGGFGPALRRLGRVGGIDPFCVFACRRGVAFIGVQACVLGIDRGRLRLRDGDRLDGPALRRDALLDGDARVSGLGPADRFLGGCRRHGDRKCHAECKCGCRAAQFVHRQSFLRVVGASMPGRLRLPGAPVCFRIMSSSKTNGGVGCIGPLSRDSPAFQGASSLSSGNAGAGRSDSVSVSGVGSRGQVQDCRPSC